MKRYNEIEPDQIEQEAHDLCVEAGVDPTGSVAGRIERVSKALGLPFSRENDTNAAGWNAIRAHIEANTPALED